MIGLLISMGLMLVLSVVLLNSLNQAMTGEKSAMPGTVASFKDKEYLRALYLSMVVSDQLGDKPFITPSTIAGSEDISLNTTANLFSAMIMQQYTIPAQLISGNEYSPNVWRDEDYNYRAHNPYDGVFWDPNFVADLDVDSNNSFAHIPLYGRRYQRYWKFSADSRAPLLGNRGPINGVDDSSSYTYGRNRKWGGHIAFGDGHVDFFASFFPSGLTYDEDGLTQHDNIIASQHCSTGCDALLIFTTQ